MTHLLQNWLKTDDPMPLAVNRLQAAALCGICPRSFDEHFSNIRKLKIGRSARFSVSDLRRALEEMAKPSPQGNRTTTENLGETASDPQGSARSDAEGAH